MTTDTVLRSTFQAIGTRWEIQVYEHMTGAAWAVLLARVQARITVFDAAYSRFRSDSLVSTMARRAGTHLLPPDGFQLLQFYERLYKATAGRVTPLIGWLMEDAGYDATYTLKSRALRQPPAWEEVLSYNHATITLRRPVLLDFGAAGKGYLVDIIGKQLEKEGVHSYLINAGGDIRHRSAKGQPVKIGLEKPNSTDEVIGIVQLSNRSLCASAGSKRTWGAYHHLINPATLASPHHILASWAVADDTMTADGLATALFFAEPQKLTQYFSFSYAVLHDDMQLEYAHDFPVNAFEAQP